MTEEQENNPSLNENEKVGDYLRRVRETRGLKLESLAKSIRLNLNILQAIEDNNWGFFPTEAYLRSYISSMCEKLSIDKNIVLDKFSVEIDSRFRVEQTNVFKEQDQENSSSSGSISKVAVIIILAVIAILFFANKTLNENYKEKPIPEAPHPRVVDKTPVVKDSMENILDSLVQNELSSDSQTDEAIQSIHANDPNKKDTLRFECTTTLAKDFCIGIAVRGIDKKTMYYSGRTERIINHRDTVQIIVTAPARTRLLINGTKLDYGIYNTLLFYNGKIVKKINKALY